MVLLLEVQPEVALEVLQRVGRQLERLLVVRLEQLQVEPIEQVLAEVQLQHLELLEQPERVLLVVLEPEELCLVLEEHIQGSHLDQD